MSNRLSFSLKNLLSYPLSKQVKNNKTMKKAAYIFLLYYILIACKSEPKQEKLPFINQPDFTPEWISEDSSAYQSIHTIPSFTFTNQEGKNITEKDVKGKIYVANFMFTKCVGICPTMTENLKIVQNTFKNDPDVMILSHSVTPDRDSVSVLKKYAQKKGINSQQWHLLTGDKDKIYEIAKKQYFAGDSVGYYGKQDDFLHTENVVLLDRQRRIRGVYNGTLVIEMERMCDDIKTLKRE